MKIFGIGMVAIVGLLTEEFCKAGGAGVFLYVLLIAIGVCMVCMPRRAKH